MAAHEHINKDQSGKYVRLHRGFSGMHHDEVDTNSLGVHWVDDLHAHWADKFATDRMGEEHHGQSYPEYEKGTVITGLVHKRHIMEPGSEEHEEWSNVGDGAVDYENETPLRSGTPVHIIGATDFNLDSNHDSDREFTPRIRGRA
jgi:hypothetical protein